MDDTVFPGNADIDRLTSWVSSILSELNVGLLIYHLEDRDDPLSLRLLYANHTASEYTGSDLSKVVGKVILDAFPGLAETELPAVYADVAKTTKSAELGAFKYRGDDSITQGYYSVKAFHMPYDCVGIIFENITLRKKVEELVKKERDESKR